MKKILKILPLVMVASLSACQQYYDDSIFCFDTVVTIRLKGYQGYSGQKTIGETLKIIKGIDAISDAYKKRDVVSVYDLNQTNERIEISRDLYDLLYYSKQMNDWVAPYFNPLIGSLSNKWKEALIKGEVLSDEVIQEELEKMNSSKIDIEEIDEHYYAKRYGDALIDLGGIAKGFALDKCDQYLMYHGDGDDDYIINAGSSSILLGRNYQNKKAKAGYENTYKVKIKDLSKPTYLYLKKCTVSTSGISEQGVKIGDTVYSHIINPVTGSAVNNYDAVIVIRDSYGSNDGYLGDALSTSFMNSTIEEIQEAEMYYNVQTIVIKDDKIVYQNESIELFY